MGGKRDVVVVGGGMAGLAAASELLDRDVLVLEADDRVGGRVRSLRRGPYWLNLGAHIVAGDAGPARELAGAFDLPFVTPPGRIACVGMAGRVVKASHPEELALRLPLSLRARLSLVRVGLRLRLAHRRIQRAEPGQTLSSRDPQAFEHLPVDAELDERSLRDFIGPVHPDVEALMRVVVNRAGGEPEDTNAGYGIEGLFVAFTSRRANIVGGTERLVDALAGSIPDVRVGARVLSVIEGRNGVAVEYEAGGDREVVEAAACVVAVPAPIAADIVGGLPDRKVAALSAIRYAPFVVAGGFTNEQGSAPWDDIYALAAPDASFCMFFNPGDALTGGSGRPPGGAIVMYMAGDRARAMLDDSDAVITSRFLDDLAGLFPSARELIEGFTVARWQYGAPTPGPGRARLQAALAAPVGRIAFAGDYLQYSGLDSAIRSGQRAAQIVGTRLGPK